MLKYNLYFYGDISRWSFFKGGRCLMNLCEWILSNFSIQKQTCHFCQFSLISINKNKLSICMCLHLVFVRMFLPVSKSRLRGKLKMCEISFISRTSHILFIFILFNLLPLFAKKRRKEMLWNFLSLHNNTNLKLSILLENLWKSIFSK